MFPSEVPEPWDSFLRDLDAALTEEVRLYCVGGFAITVQYGFPRPTGDVDVLTITPQGQMAAVLAVAGRDGPLYGKHHIYVQVMGGIVTLPESYEERVTELAPGRYQKLRLLGLDPYDLALSKLERNIQRDREDVMYLAKRVPLDPGILRERYRTEQRPYLSRPEREDLTIQLWLDMIRELPDLTVD